MAFLGIGTGRCGTVSLCKVLQACGVRVTHENREYMRPWYSTSDEPILKFVRDIDHGNIDGDVAFYWMPHLDAVKRYIPDLKIICLKRDRDKMVRSFLKRWSGNSRLIPSQRDNGWGQFYPIIDAPSPQRSLELYWEFYYEWVKRHSVLMVGTEELNTDEGLNKIFDYLGIDNRVYPKERVFNQS